MRALSEPGKLRLQAGGTLNPRRHLYIERPDDATLLQLLSEGQYVNILTSRQMGKSSLMVRTAEALTKRGGRCAIVDLAAELGTPEDATTYFLGLLSKIARDLKTEVDLQAWWAERPEETDNQRLMRFFREVVLEQVPGPVVCFLDEIDSTLKLAWTDDLFTALRGMHNERPMVPAYERLTFCLIGVAAPNELIKDRRTTPYNVGRTLELRDFDLGRDDLTPLAAALSQEPGRGQAMIERVLHWTGGHPYLTTRLCASLRDIDAKGPEDVNQRVEDSFRTLDRVSNDVHFQQILRFLETRLSDGLATFNLYDGILKGVRERDRPTLAHTELKLSGLVKRDEEGCLVVRNRIYERLFDRRWVESTQPKRALEKTRRWAIAASIVLLVIAAGATGVITQLGSELRKRERLAELDITITSSENRDGARVEFPRRAAQEILEEAAPLLGAVGPVTELSLRNTRATDVAPLAGLPSLQSLDLAGTQVQDIAPLGSLTNLESLTLSGTTVRDLTPVADLIKLQRLDLDATDVEDLEPLAALTSLQKLNLSNTRVDGLGSLANLKSLQELDLTGTPVDDLSALEELTNLERLDLVRTSVVDLKPVKGLSYLKWIDIAGTNVTDLRPLKALTELQYLGIGGGDLELDQRYEYILGDLSKGFIVEDLSRIPRANRGSAAPIAVFDDLSNLTGLRWLDLYQTNISDLTPIKALQNLVGLTLGDTSVGDISPLSDLKTLQLLSLRETKISDLTPLASLTSLRVLDLDSTQVADAAPLANLTNLQELDLSGTQVADAAPLANLTNLKSLDLSKTQIPDAALLANLIKLQMLDLRNTRVSAENLAELWLALEERGNECVRFHSPVIGEAEARGREVPIGCLR